MNSDILFSIIIPMYNTEKYIAATLDSILKQKVNNYEVVIINDGSTDDSLKIVSSYENKFKKIKIINKKNAGIIEARRDGLLNASGEYVVFLDSDDLLSDDCLDIFKYNIDKYSPDIVRGNFCEVYSDGRKNVIHHFSNDMIINDESNINDFFLKIIGDYKYNDVVRQAFRRNLIDPNIIPNNISMGDDVAISYICFKNAKKIKLIDNILYYYIIHDQSICHRKDSKTLMRNVKDISKLYNFLSIYLSDLKTMNIYFSQFFYNEDDKKNIIDFCKEMFSYDLIIDTRKNIKCRDLIFTKDFIFLLCILKKCCKAYLFFLKIKKNLRKLIKRK